MKFLIDSVGEDGSALKYTPEHRPAPPKQSTRPGDDDDTSGYTDEDTDPITMEPLEDPVYIVKPDGDTMEYDGEPLVVNKSTWEKIAADGKDLYGAPLIPGTEARGGRPPKSAPR